MQRGRKPVPPAPRRRGGGVPRILTLRALAAAGAAAALVGLAPSCRHARPAPVEAAVDAELLGAAVTVPGAVPHLGPRERHTRGGFGEDLFPCASADGRTIWFASDRFTGRFGIVGKTVDRPGLEHLSAGDANDIHPDISPDGRTLAFASDRGGCWDIYTVELRSRAPPRRVVRSGADTLSPRWSPDGRTIACFRRGRLPGEWGIWLLDAAGGSQTFLTEGLFPDWSPDGRSLCYQRARARAPRWLSLWRIDIDGGRRMQLAPGGDDGWSAVTPSWSPDGRWIAFAAVGATADAMGEPAPVAAAARSARPIPSIHVIASDGADLHRLGAAAAGVSEACPRFGRDGRLYFASDAEGSTHIWSVGWER